MVVYGSFGLGSRVISFPIAWLGIVSFINRSWDISYWIFFGLRLSLYFWIGYNVSLYGKKSFKCILTYHDVCLSWRKTVRSTGCYDPVSLLTTFNPHSRFFFFLCALGCLAVRSFAQYEKSMLSLKKEEKRLANPAAPSSHWLVVTWDNEGTRGACVPTAIGR